MNANPDPANSETGSNAAEPQAGQSISILRISILLLPVVLVVLLLDGRLPDKIFGGHEHLTAQLNAIINNLRIIEEAKEQWALQTRKAIGATPTAANLTDYLKNKAMPKPVAGETYNIQAIGTPATAKTPVTLATYPAGSVIAIPSARVFFFNPLDILRRSRFNFPRRSGKVNLPWMKYSSVTRTSTIKAIRRNPEGGSSFSARLRCSLLTDPLRDMLGASAEVPRASSGRQIPCRERHRIYVHDH